MWSLKGIARRSGKLFVAAVVAGAVSACFRPFYGPTATGERLSTALAQIEVQPIRTTLANERIGHYLRSELIFDLDGSGEPPPKRYKLSIIITDSLQTPIVDTQTGRAVSATLNTNANYTLTNWDGSQKIAEGLATSSATYERTAQRFADVRAARDAEIRSAKLLSEQIRTRLSAVLVSKS
ncbi:MAG TPA: LPS assembly lipoprotein LptE [Beijerinckiaceae bacterium]|jgi:LPS-assembly lipoprotein|nr:LPS assembly lipoprotein LptE [Beijerinckiaceae bacterium]